MEMAFYSLPLPDKELKVIYYKKKLEELFKGTSNSF